MLELCRERWPRLEPVDNPGFSSKILLATGDGFELPSETQQCLNEVGLMMIIFSPIGRQYRTWRDATLWVGCQEDENVELLRGQSQTLAMHGGRAFDRMDNKIADFDRCCRNSSVNVLRWFRRTFLKDFS